MTIVNVVNIARQIQRCRGSGQMESVIEGHQSPTRHVAALREIAKILGLYRKDSEGSDVPVTIQLGPLNVARE